jgi:protein TonB
MSNALPMDIVWLNLPGPGGGGGGGGSQSPKPPRQAQQPGQDKITVPAVKPAAAAIAPEVKDTEPPVQAVDAPVETLASASIPIAGVIENGMLDSDSRGPGRGPGAGGGDGSGIGPGQGPGLGKGRGGGCCEGAYRPGSGIELPRLLKEVKPLYTAPAMRAKIQGTVVLECVVGPDGAVGSMRVVRSLDHSSGLDEEAMKAARQWQFAPGRRFGEPVAVLVTIEITFNLR